jgi:hypothetical protein
MRTLHTAIVLFDRPIVGPDGYDPGWPLPDLVRVRGIVSGLGGIYCLVPAAVVGELARKRATPTWADLESVWPSVSTALREKIRAGRFSGTRGRTTDRPEVALSITDLPPE